MDENQYITRTTDKWSDGAVISVSILRGFYIEETEMKCG
jgi:hypothetical protein